MQCDFQVIYASGIKGKAGLDPENLADDLGPLFESIIRCIPGPNIKKDGALQMLVSVYSLYHFSPLFFEKKIKQHSIKKNNILAICVLNTINK